jgi:hypothetical protein
MADQEIADLKQLDGAESPAVLATNKQGVLEGNLDPAVDNEEAVVRTVTDEAYGRRRRLHRLRGIGSEPLELRRVRRIASQAFDIQRRDDVARLDVFDGDLPTIGEADQRTLKETTSARSRTARSSRAWLARAA